jgi:CRISPR-associated protein Cas1
MRTIMMRRSRQATGLQDNVRSIDHALASMATAASLSELMGYEGIASKAYFQSFRKWLRQPMSFGQRVRRPPRDPVNALLSLGYTLLLSDCITALEVAGLDPYIGYLHTLHYGRPALALDLMEEFRPVIVDSIVLGSFNKNMFKTEDFTEREHGIELTTPARKQFYKLYEARIGEEIVHPILGIRMSYRRAVQAQARLLAHAIVSEIMAPYVAFRVR